MIAHPGAREIASRCVAASLAHAEARLATLRAEHAPRAMVRSARARVVALALEMRELL